MARTYGATTDQHRFSAINEILGAFSIGAWVQRSTQTTWDTIYSRCTSSSTSKLAFQIAEADELVLEVPGGGGEPISTTTVLTSGWSFVAVDKAAGVVTPRVHIWKSSTGKWIHENMSGTVGNPAAVGAGGTVRIGEWTGGTTDNFSGDIEVVVEYSGVQLSDAQWESLAFSRAGMLSKRPSGLWELRQASVEQKVLDLSGNGMNESVRSGTSVTTRSCPFYFTGGGPLYTFQPSGKAEPVDLAASLSGTGTLSGALLSVASLVANLSGTGALTAQLGSVASMAANLSGAGTLSGEISALASMVANLSGAGGLAADLRELASMAARLEGAGVLSAELHQVANLSGALTGSGSLTALLELLVGAFASLPTQATIDPQLGIAAVDPSIGQASIDATAAQGSIDPERTLATMATTGASATLQMNPEADAEVTPARATQAQVW